MTLTLEGVLGSLLLVILVIGTILALVTGVFGSCAYVMGSGVQSIRGEPMPDFGTFMLIVGGIVIVLFLGAISS